MENEEDEISESSPKEIMLAYHRRQKKELMAKTTALRRSVEKGDKKRKKEVTLEIQRLENELKERQSNDLAQMESLDRERMKSKEPLKSDARQEGDQVTPAEPQQHVSKAQKRREKKAETERKRAEAEAEDMENAEFAPRRIESVAIEQFLSARNLVIHEIPPNGDCLFNAVAHQLSHISDLQISGIELRRKAAAYIRENKDEYLPFLTKSDGEPIDEFEFDEYCGKIARSSEDGGEWGGEPELRALASVLERRIEVIQPEGRSTYFGDEYSNKKSLIITYHRYAYNLGEHYNSTK